MDGKIGARSIVQFPHSLLLRITLLFLSRAVLRGARVDERNLVSADVFFAPSVCYYSSAEAAFPAIAVRHAVERYSLDAISAGDAC